MNKLAISGQVILLDELRYTPAGLPLLSFVISHVSEAEEAGLKRKVVCEIKAVVIGEDHFHACKPVPAVGEFSVPYSNGLIDSGQP